eukprot:753234-Pelagomonas_calceolata.AAC.8
MLMVNREQNKGVCVYAHARVPNTIGHASLLTAHSKGSPALWNFKHPLHQALSDWHAHVYITYVAGTLHVMHVTDTVVEEIDTHKLSREAEGLSLNMINPGDLDAMQMRNMGVQGF